MTTAQGTSVQHEIVVEAPIERAFSVFTKDFGAFKPREHNMLSVDIVETVFEAREGGHIYDRGVDGSECRWARILAYEPPNRVVFSAGVDSGDGWPMSPAALRRVAPRLISPRQPGCPRHGASFNRTEQTVPTDAWSVQFRDPATAGRGPSA